tara:strand:+ start:1886 stop:2500 length:615 start_codon:yes stop_codon:yes gene_type:complete
MKKLTDYYVDIDILKNSLFDDDSIYDPKTERFRNLTEKQQERELKTAYNEWWDKYGLDYYNSHYNDKIGGIEELQGDIVSWFDTEIRNNINHLQKKTIGDYTDKYKKDTIKLVGMKRKKNDKQETTADKSKDLGQEFDWRIKSGEWVKVPTDSPVSVNDLDVKMEMISERILQNQLEIKVWTDYYNDLKDMREGNEKEKINEKE